MRLALYQAPSPAGDIPAGLATIQTALTRAAAEDVALLVLPELFLPGYMATEATPPEGWEGTLATLSGMVREAGVALCIGLPDYTDGTVTNTAQVFGRDGSLLACHRKIQCFGEREQALFTPGDRYTCFDFEGRRFGLLICYDVEFPEHVRALARMGCDVILVPTANMMPFTNVQNFLVPARAAENAVTIAYANLCGAEGDTTYTGQSTIYGPDGYSLAAKGQSEGMAMAVLPTPGWSEHGLPDATQLADLREIPKT